MAPTNTPINACARDEKEQLNRFLGEYLALCLAIGMSADSGFNPSAGPRPKPRSGGEV